MTAQATRKNQGRPARPRAAAWAGMVACLCCWLETGSVASVVSARGAETPDHVVVLHGMARTESSMTPLAERIAAAGYRVFNVGYPGRKMAPEELVAVLRSALAECCADAERLHFVTHSLGGILVRASRTPVPINPSPDRAIST